ncbi:MAG: phenylacetate-CoA oxygenase/reductase subunit PaaK [Chitinophagaceae bacterium]|nr:phenylacetate-CoA oxygenase/reductase subunit PaaK [Chitinophagaceae bacterium]
MTTPQFHSLRVKDIRKETATCVSVALDIPQDLKETFAYQAGQYITFKKDMDGEELRRSYSLCSSPLEDDFRVAIKQIRGGKFSTYANKTLKVGDTLEVMPPMGNFVLKPDTAKAGHYLAFVAGSGITPVLSMIKTTLQQEPESRFTLVYGNQNFQSIIFREAIEALKSKYLHRLQVIHILSRERMETELNYGRISTEKCAQLFTRLIDLESISQFLLCGPEEMIHCIKDYLIGRGVAQEKIRFELFNTSTSAKQKEEYQAAHAEDAGKMCSLTIKVDDRSFDLPLAYTGESILDAALKHGADLPFACKGGVCCTCRAKVIEGEVEMEVNYALEPDEVANGFVLTCQAHPKSDRVVIDFDAR